MPETLQMTALRRKIGKKTVGVRLSSKTHFLHPDYMQNITLNTLVIRTKLRRSMIGANRFLSAQKSEPNCDRYSGAYFGIENFALLAAEMRLIRE